MKTDFLNQLFIVIKRKPFKFYYLCQNLVVDRLILFEKKISLCDRALGVRNAKYRVERTQTFVSLPYFDEDFMQFPQIKVGK